MMGLKKATIVLLFSLIGPFHYYGQEASDPRLIQKTKTKVTHHTCNYIEDGIFIGSQHYTRYHNKKGWEDSLYSYGPDGQLQEIYHFFHLADGSLSKHIRYNQYLPKGDTVMHRTLSGIRDIIEEHDAKGNLTLSHQLYENDLLSYKTIFHYDSCSHLLGRETYNYEGKLAYSDTKEYSGTGKLVYWNTRDGNNKITAYIKRFYDPDGLLILELDSGERYNNRIEYEYLTFNKVRELKRVKHYSHNRLQYRDVFSYRSLADGSYIESFRSRGYGLFASERWRIDSYYSADKQLFKKQHYLSRKGIMSVEYYTNNKRDSSLHYKDRKLTSLYRYRGDDIVFKLRLSTTGDTLELEESSFNDLHLVTKKRVVRKSNPIDKKANAVEQVRTEEIIDEYWYEYYED